jgi:hypothetical protein
VRDKRVERRTVGGEDKVPDVIEVADWLLVNETRWGLPHGNLALLAAVFVGVRAMASLVDRILAAVLKVPRGRSS